MNRKEGRMVTEAGRGKACLRRRNRAGGGSL